tara:strand:+ start:60 stop:674 length:615 start_codon:yes stop_codon:yes gene_type:complete
MKLKYILNPRDNWERATRHMSPILDYRAKHGLIKKAKRNTDNLLKVFAESKDVFIFDLDKTTFIRPKIFTHKIKFSFKKGFYLVEDLATYIFWDSFIVSLFDRPLPLAKKMKRFIREGKKVGIYTARQYRWFSKLWIRLKIGKVSFIKFRPKGDNTIDHELKERYLKECIHTYDYFTFAHIVAYDDNAEIIKMYHQNDIEGIKC